MLWIRSGWLDLEDAPQAATVHPRRCESDVAIVVKIAKPGWGVALQLSVSGERAGQRALRLVVGPGRGLGRRAAAASERGSRIERFANDASEGFTPEGLVQ